MPTPKLKQAHCNTCSGQRPHEIRDNAKTRDEHEGVYWGQDNLFLECIGCKEVKILRQTWCSEETDEHGQVVTYDTYFPSSIFRKVPEWMNGLDRDWHMTKLLLEIYSALQNEQPTLAAMGIRSLIEVVMIDKVGDKGSFGKNLTAFQSGGFVSTIQVSALQGALELGHASIHRSHTPSSEELKLALDIVENIVHVLYVLEKSTKKTFKSVPKRGA